MPAGRPTKCTPEFIETAKKYLEQFENYGDVIPSIAGLSVVAKVARETLHAWYREDKNDEFSHIFREILSKQESLLINKGLTGEFNPAIAKLALGKHGYSDKADVNQTVGGQLDLTTKSDEELNARLAALVTTQQIQKD